MIATTCSNSSIVTEFEERGFVTVPGALTPDQVASLDAAVHRYRAEFPGEWVDFDDRLIQTANMLPRVSDFDVAIENPVTLDLVRAILGEDATFEELAITIRKPTAEDTCIKGWHRDIIRAFDRRMEIEAISVIYYLTDVTEHDHCFSIIPGTHGPRAHLRPEDITPDMACDVLGPAGSALLFHARCLHAGRLKPHSRERRTIHVYFERAGRPRTSEWSDIPPRLAHKHDPALPPPLYSKWDSRDVIDGTGRKPRDVDPSLSFAEMVRIVQQRANSKM